MGEGDRSVGPGQAVVGQAQFGEGGGNRAKGVDGGAVVVEEAGQGQFRRATAPARGGGGFQHEHRKASSSEDGGGGEAVGAGANHYSIQLSIHRRPRLFQKALPAEFLSSRTRAAERVSAPRLRIVRWPNSVLGTKWPPENNAEPVSVSVSVSKDLGWRCEPARSAAPRCRCRRWRP